MSNDAAWGLPPPYRNNPLKPSDSPKPSPGILGYTGDALKGIANAPSNLADSIVSLGEDIVSWATGDEQEWFNVPKPSETNTWAGTVTEEAGSFALGLFSGSVILSGLSKAGKLGKLAKLAGYASKAAKGKYGWKYGMAANAVLGAPVDFLLADTEEGNLSNLIEDFPVLANPVSQFLAHDDDDGKLTRRLKNAVEGIPLGIATDFLFTGLSRILRHKKAKLKAEFGEDRLAREAAAQAEVGGPVLHPDPNRAAMAAFEETEEAVEAISKISMEDFMVKDRRLVIPDVVLRDRESLASMYAKASSLGSEAKEAFIKNIEGSTNDGETIAILNFFRELDDRNLSRTMKDMVADANQFTKEQVAQGLEDMLGIPKNAKGIFDGTAENLQHAGRDLQFMRITLVNGADRLVQLSEKVKGNASDVDRIQLVSFFRTFSDYIEKFRESRGNLARALKMFDTTVDPDGIRLKRAYEHPSQKQNLNDLIRGLKEKLGQEFNPKIADEVAEFVLQNKHLLKAGKFYQAMRKTQVKGVRFWNALLEWRLTSMLSGAATHVIDRIGTVGNQGIRYGIDNPIASLVGLVRGTKDRLTLDETLTGLTSHLEGTIYFFKQLGTQLRKSSDENGWWKTLLNFGESVKHAQLGDKSRQLTEHMVDKALDSSYLGIQNKAVGSLIDSYGRIARGLSFGVMNFGDASSATATFFGEARMRIKQLARIRKITDDAWQERMMNAVIHYHKTGTFSENGKSLLNEQLRKDIKSVADKAVEQAQHVTYKQDMDPSGFTGKFVHWVNRKDNHKSIVFKMFITPFVKTPINIMDNVFAHTPGLRKFSYEFRRAMSSGSQAEKDLMTAKLISGSAAYLSAGILYASGMLTGAHDKKDRDHLIAAGIPEYSIRIGNKYYSYNRADPFGMYLGIAADLGSALRYLGEEEGMKASATVIVAFSTQFASKSYLQGLGDLWKVVTDPHRHLQSYTANQLAPMNPLSGLQRTFTGSVTPELKEARTITDRFLNGTVLKGALPDKRDAFGMPVAVEDAPLQTLLGIRTKALSDSPAYQEMARFRLFPKDRPGRVEGVELTEQEYLQFKDTLRELGTAEALDKMVSSVSYRRMTDRSKADALQKAINRYRKIARQLMIRNSPDLKNRIIQYRRILAKLHGAGELSPIGEPDPSEIINYDRSNIQPDI